MGNLLNIENLIEEINNLQSGKALKLKVMINASAKTNSIEFCDEFIKIRIKERAVEGKANKAIIEYMSEILKISKNRIEIVSGHTSRIKMIQIKS